MNKTITRVFSFDGDSCEVVFRYDPDFGKYFGEYPDFEETPKFTPRGRPWVTAMQDGCKHGQNKDDSANRCLDCGSCIFFYRERLEDLIGICKNEKKCETRREDGR